MSLLHWAFRVLSISLFSPLLLSNASHLIASILSWTSSSGEFNSTIFRLINSESSFEFVFLCNSLEPRVQVFPRVPSDVYICHRVLAFPCCLSNSISSWILFNSVLCNCSGDSNSSCSNWGTCLWSGDGSKLVTPLQRGLSYYCCLILQATLCSWQSDLFLVLNIFLCCYHAWNTLQLVVKTLCF